MENIHYPNARFLVENMFLIDIKDLTSVLLPPNQRKSTYQKRKTYTLDLTISRGVDICRNVINHAIYLKIQYEIQLDSYRIGGSAWSEPSRMDISVILTPISVILTP